MREIVLTLILLGGCKPFTAPQDDLPQQKMKLLWEIPYEFIGTAVNSTPMLLGDSLVIMTAGRDLMAIEQASGKVRWKTFVSDQTNLQTDVFRTDGTRLFATHVQDVRAYNVIDGSLLWLLEMPSEGGGFWENEVALAKGKLFVPGYRTVYCLNSETGVTFWKKDLQSRGLIGSTVRSENRVLVGGAYGVTDSSGKLIGGVGKVYALSDESGDTLWTSLMTGDSGPMDLVVDNGVIYGGTRFPFSSASFEAFNAETGERIWSYYTPNEGWDYYYAIVVGDRVIANAGPYHVAAFNKHTGQLLWRTFITWNANAEKLHYYNGYVYHPHGIRIYILDPETGRVVYTLDGANQNRLYTMAAGNGKIFVQGSRYLQCYEAYKP